MGKLIDIDRLCNDLAKRWSIADKKKEDIIRAVMADVVTPIVVSQPTVDAVPVVHGRWIHHDSKNDNVPSYDECNQCEWKVRIGLNFCPWCGARMDGKGNGNEAD